MKVQQNPVGLILCLILLPVMAIASGPPCLMRPQPMRGAPEDWHDKAVEMIQDHEYSPSLQMFDYKGEQFSRPRLHFTNRAQNLRAYFDERGMELMPRIFNKEHVHDRCRPAAVVPFALSKNKIALCNHPVQFEVG